MAALRRFSESDIGTLRQMAERGHDGKSIALALGRTAQSVRVKAVELGIALRPPSLDTRRIKLKAGTWTVLESEARRFNTTPSRLARLIIETVVADDLVDAVLDGLPRSLRRPTAKKRERKWEVALAQQTILKRPRPLDGLRDSKSPIPPEWSHHRAILSAKCCAGNGDWVEQAIFPFTVLNR